MSNNKQSMKPAISIHYKITMCLRLVKITDRYNVVSLGLQQMWQGSDGSVKWEYVEIIEMKGGNNEQR